MNKTFNQWWEKNYDGKDWSTFERLAALETFEYVEVMLKNENNICQSFKEWWQNLTYGLQNVEHKEYLSAKAAWNYATELYNSVEYVTCRHWKKDWPICGIGFSKHCKDKPCKLSQHQ